MTETPDWADMPFFLAIAQTGSLRAAAQLLNSTHATVSRHLASLESAYAVRLFERSVDGLTLTLAGQELLPLAQQAECAVIGARRRLQGLDSEAAGSVRLSVPPSLAYNILPPIFAEFIAQYPNIDLKITVTDQFQDIARSETDVSVRVANAVNDDVLGRKLVQYWSGIYASESYINEVLPNAGPKGEGLTWIDWAGFEPRPDWIKSSPFPNASLRHEAAAGLMQMHLVLNGVGMSNLPCYAQAYEAGLRLVPNTETYPDRNIWLLLHSDLKDTMRVRLLVEFLAKALKSRRALFETGIMS